MAWQLTNEAVDAMHNAFGALMATGVGVAAVEIWTAGFVTKVAEFFLDGANPMTSSGPGDGTERDIDVNEGDGDFTTFGLAAGEAAACRLVNKNGDRTAEGTVTGTGGGGDITVSNVNVAVGQPVSLTSLTMSMDAALGPA